MLLLFRHLRIYSWVFCYFYDTSARLHRFRRIAYVLDCFGAAFRASIPVISRRPTVRGVKTKRHLECPLSCGFGICIASQKTFFFSVPQRKCNCVIELVCSRSWQLKDNGNAACIVGYAGSPSREICWYNAHQPQQFPKTNCRVFGRIPQYFRNFHPRARPSTLECRKAYWKKACSFEVSSGPIQSRWNTLKHGVVYRWRGHQSILPSAGASLLSSSIKQSGCFHSWLGSFVLPPSFL
jgi:hypothetical protein